MMQPDNQGKSCTGGARPMYINVLQHLDGNPGGLSDKLSTRQDEISL